MIKNIYVTLIVLFFINSGFSQINGLDTVCINSKNIYSYTLSSNGYTIWSSPFAALNQLSSTESEIEWNTNGQFDIRVFEYDINSNIIDTTVKVFMSLTA